jgi:hypothetical protein
MNPKYCRILLVLLLSVGAPIALATDLVHSQGTLRSFVPEPEPDAYLISFANGYTIDTRTGEPSLHERYRLNEPAAGKIYRIIQFTGPIRQEWLKELGRKGVLTFGYLPHYAVLAKLDRAQCETVRSLSPVAWVGIFQPIYKLEDRLLNASGTRKIVIQIMPGEDYVPVNEYLLEHGGKDASVITGEFGATLTVTIDASLIPDIARLPEVIWLQEWQEPTLCNNNGQWVTQTGWRSSAPPDTSKTARRVWQKGVRGQRIVLGVTDTGLNLSPTGHDLFRDPSLAVTPPGIWPGHRKVVTYKLYSGASANESPYHGSHVNGTVAGDDSVTGGSSYYDGMSIKGRIYFVDVSSSGGSLVTPNNLWTVWDSVHAGRGLADSLRAYQQSSSWGWSNSSGTYLVQDASTDAYSWQHKDFLILMAAGNEYSTRTIRNPGIAKDVITVGALQNGTSSNAIASFSSRGPTQDNRIKPTLCDPGQDIYSATASPNTNTYSSMDGTSMATPMMNGSVGLIRCYLKEGYYPSGARNVTDTFGYISAALLRSMAIVSGDPNVGSYTIPSFDVGWGRIDLDSVLYFTGDKRHLIIRDDTIGVSTGQYTEFTFQVDSSTVPLRISLAWTDTAAANNANPTLVNDLNLEVLAPGGSPFYRGNQYTSGQSTPNPAAWDNRNVEECVRVNSPATGTWTIRVRGNNVVTARQPYAYAITGAVSAAPLPQPDVGCTRIIAPSGTLDSGAVTTPACSVYNYGAATATFAVRMKIGAAYNQTAGVTSLAPGARQYVTFSDWTSSPRGTLAVTCSTELTGDTALGNDKQTGTVTVAVHDVGATAILAPSGTVDSGTVVTPRAVVTNLGSTTESFYARFTIGGFYADSQPAALASGETDTLDFQIWIAGPLGVQITGCSTMLAGDANPANDRCWDSVRVIPLSAIEEQRLGLPRALSLDPIPNPFGGRTTICYGLPNESRVTLTVYSSAGKLVRVLDNRHQPSGYHRTIWDGRDDYRRPVGHGVYYCCLATDGFRLVRKLVKVQ